VESERGHGTTFRVYFPRATQQADAPSLALASPKPLRGSETILIAEDQSEVRHVVRATLKRYGYTVLEATSGEEALQIVRANEQPIDLLLTDVVMPSMSGPALAAEVRAIRPDIRVLFASGYTDDAIVRHGAVQDDLAFIEKPFTPQGLARKVRDVLDSAA
jgi:CheY-like chemotaxis protein